MIQAYTGWDLTTEPPKHETYRPPSIESLSRTYEGERFTKEELSKKKIEELKELCKKYELMTAGTKIVLVERLHKRTNPDHYKNDSAFMEFQINEFWKQKITSTNLHLEYYEKHFNPSDCIDRYWYEYIWDEKKKDGDWVTRGCVHINSEERVHFELPKKEILHAIKIRLNDSQLQNIHHPSPTNRCAFL